MVMKKYHKMILKLFKKHFTRLLSIAAILTVSIGLVTGVGASTKKVKISANEYYEEYNVSDLNLKSSNTTGFSESDIEKLNERYLSSNISVQMFAEVNTSRFQFLDLDNVTINKFDLESGKMPENDLEILCERETTCIKEHNVGDTVSFNNQTYTICGIVTSSYYFQKKDEPLLSDSSLNVSEIFYLNYTTYSIPNDIYITLSDRNIDSLSDSYLENVKAEKEWILENIENVSVLTLEENASFKAIYTLTDKIEIIGWVIMAAFMIVALLVILTTVSRLIEEERSQIACLKSLGYSDITILHEFIIFTINSLVIGAIVAFPVGYAITNLIYVNFDQYFKMPKMTSNYDINYYLISLSLMSLVSILTSFISSIKILKEKTAEMFRKKAPRAGKKILLEHTHIWNHLKFKYKCTARNLFRNKKHFFMTVISVMGSTILIFISSGLLSYSFSDSSMGLALRAICIVILICAAILTAVIIYVLTNINLSERNRELATLMVLGYTDKEVSMHIYREIYIMSFIGSLLGIPFGYLTLDWVFHLLDFGSMSLVSWSVYVLSPILSMFFTFIVTILLKHKITGIDMNDSLKSLE